MADEHEDDVLARLIEERKKRFRILVCIDGSDECYESLRYAARLGRGPDADIILLNVRLSDYGLSSGGLQVNVARENMLEWGLELPGIRYLKKGRDLLIDLGVMGEDWRDKATHTTVEGDPLGDNKIEYRNDNGKSIVLKLKVAPDVATGIIEQFDLGPYNLIILGAPSEKRSIAKAMLDPSIADQVVVNAPCSVLVARKLSVGTGHLICTNGSERSMEMVRKDGLLARRFETPVSILSVAADESREPAARVIVEHAERILRELDVEVLETLTRVGDPVKEIVAAGEGYSLIVLTASSRNRLQQFFKESVAMRVMLQSRTSVMIVR